MRLYSHSVEPNTRKDLKQNPAEHLGECLSVPVPVKDVLRVRIYNSSGSLESCKVSTVVVVVNKQIPLDRYGV